MLSNNPLCIHLLSVFGVRGPWLFNLKSCHFLFPCPEYTEVSSKDKLDSNLLVSHNKDSTQLHKVIKITNQSYREHLKWHNSIEHIGFFFTAILKNYIHSHISHILAKDFISFLCNYSCFTNASLFTNFYLFIFRWSCSYRLDALCCSSERWVGGAWAFYDPSSSSFHPVKCLTTINLNSPP